MCLFLHAYSWIGSSFLFLALINLLLSQCITVYHLPMEGHTGCFQVLAVMHKTDIKPPYANLCVYMTFVHLYKQVA